MEAEQSRKDRESSVGFGQKRVKMGACQSHMAKTVSAALVFQVLPFLTRKAPGAPVFDQDVLFLSFYKLNYADLAIASLSIFYMTMCKCCNNNLYKE